MLTRIATRLRSLSQEDFRHYGGFVLAGGTAFLVDISILHLQTDLFDVDPLLARPISILIAMVVSWWINRTITFSVGRPPSFAEFAQFAAVVWVAQAVNYALFATILLALPETIPAVAVAAATSVSMCISYMGYRFGVFRTSGRS